MQTKFARTVAQLLGKEGFRGMACAVSARPNLMNVERFCGNVVMLPFLCGNVAMLPFCGLTLND
jgi:hypothetical protein